MGRPAREEVLSIRCGHAEMVVRVTAPSKREARRLRPSADAWLSLPGHQEALRRSVLAWLTMMGSALHEEPDGRQLPLPLEAP